MYDIFSIVEHSKNFALEDLEHQINEIYPCKKCKFALNNAVEKCNKKKYILKNIRTKRFRNSEVVWDYSVKFSYELCIDFFNLKFEE